MSRLKKCLPLLAILGVLSACQNGPDPSKTTYVFAAASLAGPFQELAKTFEQEHPGTRLELQFQGTSSLVLQCKEGAPADVFASADEHNMAKIVAFGGVIDGPHLFARNRLTIVTPKGNPKHIQGLQDFARTDLKVVLCGGEVPIGRYAREALQKAQVVAASVSDEPSVTAVLSKVRLGEVDGGIVYETDAQRAKGEVESLPIDQAFNIVARYPIAVLNTGSNPTVAKAFVDFVRSDRGQTTLQAFGFTAP